MLALRGAAERLGCVGRMVHTLRILGIMWERPGGYCW
jgi:hypothetical protein